ncbi:MAG: LysE family translocator [Pseudomonadota bacterium]
MANLFLALGILTLGLVSFGPNILAIIGTSMQQGRREGSMLALGIGSGSGLWAALTVTGLTALITTYAWALLAIKVFGTAYLLWLSYGAFRSAFSPAPALTEANSMQGHNLYLRGLAIQMTNPKAALYWVAIAGVGLGPAPPLWVSVSLVISATTISIAAHLIYARAFSAQPVIGFYQRARRWIHATLGIFFTFAAFRLALWHHN